MFHRIFEHRMGRRFTRDDDGGPHRGERGDRPGFGGRQHDHDHGGRGGGRFGQGFRRGRVFDHGELRYVILALIGEQPRHGYEIIKEIEDRLGGAYSPSPGVVYPTLTMLQEIGHATVAEAGAGKKLYAITPEGQAFLALHKQSVDAIFARMEEAGASSNGGRVPQIMRATHNLKLALRLRLSRGSLSEEQVHKITTALDAAATAIERS